MPQLRDWWNIHAGRACAELRIWAGRNTPHVSLEQIDAVVGAVGEISIAEAHRVLERLEQERQESAH
jgi:hypothetical protein